MLIHLLLTKNLYDGLPKTAKIFDQCNFKKIDGEIIGLNCLIDDYPDNILNWLVNKKIIIGTGRLMVPKFMIGCFSNTATINDINKTNSGGYYSFNTINYPALVGSGNVFLPETPRIFESTEVPYDTKFF